VLETFDVGQRLLADLVEPPQIPGEGMYLAVDRVPAHVLEQIVVRMDAVERRMRGMCLVEITEQVVDEVRKGLRSYHRFLTPAPRQR